MTVRGRSAQLRWVLLMSLPLNRQGAQGWCPEEQRLWGALLHPAPIWHGNPLPYIKSVPILTGVSTKILGSGHSQETTAIKFLASLNLLIICQVATLHSPTL